MCCCLSDLRAIHWNFMSVKQLFKEPYFERVQQIVAFSSVWFSFEDSSSIKKGTSYDNWDSIALKSLLGPQITPITRTAASLNNLSFFNLLLFNPWYLGIKIKFQMSSQCKKYLLLELGYEISLCDSFNFLTRNAFYSFGSLGSDCQSGNGSLFF